MTTKTRKGKPTLHGFCRYANLPLPLAKAFFEQFGDSFTENVAMAVDHFEHFATLPALAKAGTVKPRDVSPLGCITWGYEAMQGGCNGFIYTVDTVKFFAKHRAAIMAFLAHHAALDLSFVDLVSMTSKAGKCRKYGLYENYELTVNDAWSILFVNRCENAYYTVNDSGDLRLADNLPGIMSTYWDEFVNDFVWLFGNLVLILLAKYALALSDGHLTIARRVKAIIAHNGLKAFSLYAGYGKNASGELVRWQGGALMRERTNEKGRKVYGVYAYADGSELVYRYCEKSESFTLEAR